MELSGQESYLTRKKLEAMSVHQRMAYLREQWALTQNEVFGRLVTRKLGSGNTVWIIVGATNGAGKPLEYPIADFPDRFEDLQGWVHVGNRPGDLEEGAYVRGTFSLAPEHVREQRQNPLAIGVDPSTVERIRQVVPSDVRMHTDGTLNVSETLAYQYVQVEHAEALHEVEALRAERDVLTTGVANLTRKKREVESALEEAEREIEAAKAEEQRARRRQQRVLKGIQDRAQKQRQKKASELREMAAEVEKKIEEWKDDQRAAMEREWNQHQARVKSMHEQAERLRAYVRMHADRLVRLDLITEGQRRELLGEPSADLEDLASRPTPETLETGWAGVVPRVQRYLLENGGIVYPRALLEAYLALVLAGDLVVLSGLSGSGKTQLVRAFADATGGKVHVVPVKPNWTSSEDLLGYYNPIQRAYLSTPFLDALIAAKRDPGRMHYVCLDEMNLARVEYYFADFLSAMEARGWKTDGDGNQVERKPLVQLYSDEEAGHVTAEFRVFVDVVMKAAGEADDLDLGGLLSQGDIAAQLNERLGLGDGESLVELHGRLRRMVSGVLNVPSELIVPSNVRIVGAVNVDETTHTLAPKVLDRAHVLRFGSPLDVWDRVVAEVEAAREANIPGEQVFLPSEIVERGDYPEYDPETEDPMVEKLTAWRSEYFVPLGLDFGLRLARQAMRFRDELGRVTSTEGEALTRDALVHVLRQKVLPRFSFDGSRPPRPKPSGDRRPEASGLDVVDAFRIEVNGLGAVGPYEVSRELEVLLAQARSDRAGGIFNYWA